MSRPAAIDKRPGGILMCWETEKLWDFIKSFKSLQWMYQNTADGLLLHFCDMIFHLPKKKDVSLTKYSFNFRGICCWADLMCRVYSWVKKSNINATDRPSTTNCKIFEYDFTIFQQKDQLELTKRFRYMVYRWQITNHPTDFAVTAESWIGPYLLVLLNLLPGDLL